MTQEAKKVEKAKNIRKTNRQKIAVSVLGRNISENNGINVRAKSIAELVREEHDAVLIGRGNKAQVQKDAIIVTPEKTKLWNLKLIPAIIQNKFNCVYCVGDLFGFLTYYALSKIYHYRVMFDATGIYSQLATTPRFGATFYKILERLVVKSADHVTAIAGYVSDFYSKYRNVALLPLFIDEDVFRRQEVQSGGDCEERKLLGMIGPFDSSSNNYYRYFLEANLGRFNKELRFLLIGRCDQKIEDECVEYTGYLASVQDYVRQLSTLDAVLLPHKPLDPGPYSKILESMSCALPVFTTPEGIIGLDFVAPGKDILVFEEEELADKVSQLIFDDKLMKEIGQNARITVEKHYSKKANRTMLLDALRILEDEQH